LVIQVGFLKGTSSLINVRAEPAGVNPKITPVYPVSGNLIKSPTFTDNPQLFKTEMGFAILGKLNGRDLIGCDMGHKTDLLGVVSPPESDSTRVNYN
jgi:hypothetical protein